MVFKTYKQNSEPKLMYLDQNIWIYLAQVHYGKNTDPRYIRVYNKIKKLVEDGKLLIPINLSNLAETNKISDEDRRVKLADFITLISKGYSFRPYLYIQKEEILNYIKRQIYSILIEQQKYELAKTFVMTDLRKNMIQIDFGNLMGSSPEVVSNAIPPEKLAQYNEKFNEMLKTSEILNTMLKEYIPADKNLALKYIQDAEQARKVLLQWKDKVLRKKVPLAQYATHYLIPKIMEVVKELHYQSEYLDLLFPKFENEKSVMTFLHQFPMMYTQHNLIFRRDLEVQRKIDDHDLNDILSYVFPIAYFDYVVGERFFISVAKSAGLDTLFGTFLCKNLLELEAELDKC